MVTIDPMTGKTVTPMIEHTSAPTVPGESGGVP